MQPCVGLTSRRSHEEAEPVHRRTGRHQHDGEHLPGRQPAGAPRHVHPGDDPQLALGLQKPPKTAPKWQFALRKSHFGGRFHI
jgi:hypothetical protein